MLKLINSTKFSDGMEIKCFFCGKTKSVKYIVDIDGEEVFCCNKCALMRIDKCTK